MLEPVTVMRSRSCAMTAAAMNDPRRSPALNSASGFLLCIIIGWTPQKN
jgi:hypothetical protein